MRTRALEQLYTYHNRSKARLSRIMNLPMEVRAEGCEIIDEQENRYLDCGGFGVFILGHRHPKVVESVRAQLDLMPMSSRLLVNGPLAEASQALIESCPDNLRYCFFTNSGAESTELALKLVRANGCKKVIALSNSYHGKTLGALSVTYRAEFRQPFGPLLFDVEFVPREDITALEHACTHQEGRCAIIAEVVQGEGGVFPLSMTFIQAIERMRERYGCVVIYDEIQSGLGRTGELWALDKYNSQPDIMLIGKALSGGVVPCAAIAATESLFCPLNNDFMLHSSTFGGSQISLAAATATLKVISDENIVLKARQLGREIKTTFTELVQGRDIQIRGEGLLIGVDTGCPAKAGRLALNLLKQRVITSNTLSNANTLRFSPSALLEERHLDHLFDAFSSAINKL
ncbi:aspartate aminotransferase family protein [Photobacterium leiognathi]|uniref:aspartate aminotransferase family protein n=1 Tax=Photobacterium leiognathi TaxID=553611 RepID=UPI002980D27A|nr:aminotransferase class III-fold pyridoxal phosphate-dependent enzyme [Photobacterium leiognathi]